MDRTTRLFSTACLSLLCCTTLIGCITRPPPSTPLLGKLVSVTTDDYKFHELLEDGEKLALAPTVKDLLSEGFVENFAVLPDRDHQLCDGIQVPIAGTARPPEGHDGYILDRDPFSGGYRIMLYVDRSCQVIRAEGSKMMPNTF